MQTVGSERARIEESGAPVNSARGGRLRSSEAPRRESYDGAPARRRAARALNRRCAKAARRIRRSSGVVPRAGGRADAGLGRRTWPRLLLWVFACAALVVSTMMRAEAVRQREASASLRAAVTEGSGAAEAPLFGALVRPGEAGARSARRGLED